MQGQKTTGRIAKRFVLCASLHLERQDDHLVPGHANGPLLFNSVPTDIPDWGIWFADNYNTGQARLAADFYRLVAQTVTPSTIETTGHSLGGALAGFVASLYGRKGTLFDKSASKEP